MTAPKRILLVDDEANVLKALRRTLQFDGYQIFTATNAVDALELMTVDPVDLVVSDCMMPGVTGIDLFAQMHKLWPDTVRVMLTGLSDHEVALAALERGAIFRFLTKPWDDVDLRITVRQALEHRELKLESRHLLDFMDRRHETLDTLVDVVATKA
ncbi:MAG: response regulator [Archangiaceae bacterium]|nr:response regulator [Archangiaceae bacterium]